MRAAPAAPPQTNLASRRPVGIPTGMRSLLPALAAASALLFAGCGERPASSNPSDKNTMSTQDTEVAVISTSEGDITIAFRSDKAPKTVENFKKLAKEGFYDGTCFHRIIKGFMIQGGDPLTKDLASEMRWGTGGPGYQIKAEFNDLHHARGVISMARSQHPDSAGSQFFICDGDAGFLDRQYTAFGQLIKGDDVLTKIASTPCAASFGGEKSRPTKRVEVKSVTIVPADQAK